MFSGPIVITVHPEILFPSPEPARRRLLSVRILIYCVCQSQTVRILLTIRKLSSARILSIARIRSGDSLSCSIYSFQSGIFRLSNSFQFQDTLDCQDTYKWLCTVVTQTLQYMILLNSRILCPVRIFLTVRILSNSWILTPVMIPSTVRILWTARILSLYIHTCTVMIPPTSRILSNVRISIMSGYSHLCIRYFSSLLYRNVSYLVNQIYCQDILDCQYTV
jgi:hypothetical protein